MNPYDTYDFVTAKFLYYAWPERLDVTHLQAQRGARRIFRFERDAALDASLADLSRRQARVEPFAFEEAGKFLKNLSNINPS